MQETKRYFDSVRRSLVYVGRSAGKDFWDDEWETDDLQKAVRSTPNSFVVKYTKKYLPRGSRILEGGCGRGNHVFSLQRYGFNTVGIDYAERTVEKLKKVAPDLDIRLGDVRSLPFADGSFDGYWSIGVIEHFWDGFDSIAAEMARVVRERGYLFVTFPHMSSLRKWKARLGKFQALPNSQTEPDGFYQFALDADYVAERISRSGFELVASVGMSGAKGLKDEVSGILPSLQKVYVSRRFFAKAARRLADAVFSRWAGHVRLLVFRKSHR